MYAVIVTGGKQYKVEEGDVLYIEKLDAEAEAKITSTRFLQSAQTQVLKQARIVQKLPLTLLFSRTAKVRRLLFSPTSQRRTKSARWATDSLTLRLKSQRLTLKQ